MRVAITGKSSLYPSGISLFKQFVTAYFNAQIMPAITELKINEVDTFGKSDDVVVIGVFAPGSKEEAEFKKVSESMRNEVSFGTMKPGIFMIKKLGD